MEKGLPALLTYQLNFASLPGVMVFAALILRLPLRRTFQRATTLSLNMTRKHKKGFAAPLTNLLCLATLPTRIIFAHAIFRKPLPHTLDTAKSAGIGSASLCHEWFIAPLTNLFYWHHVPRTPISVSMKFSNQLGWSSWYSHTERTLQPGTNDKTSISFILSLYDASAPMW